MNGIYDILKQEEKEYKEKMLHKIPAAIAVNRSLWLFKKLKNKKVLHFGIGPLHDELKKICNIESVDRRGGDYCIDVDCDGLPVGKYDYVLCGEFLEHLSNPGIFLSNLKIYKCPIIITVPNAFCDIGRNWIKKGIENVNLEHVCYYSYFTLIELIGRYGYAVSEFYWAGKEPIVAEGIIFVIRSYDV